MTRIDFYILNSPSAEEALLFCCRLAEKAWRSGHRVLIHSDNSAATEQLDKLLWDSRPSAFVPHSTDTGDAITLCHPGDDNTPAEMGEHCDVLINTSVHLPEAFSRFRRMAEVVVQQDKALAASRERYRFYKQRGYPLHNHQIAF